MKKIAYFIVTICLLNSCQSSYNLGDMLVEDLQQSYDIKIIKEGKDYIFIPNNMITNGIAFYPGGKVDKMSYAPLLAQLADEGYLCRLYDMPSDLAIFDTHAAHNFKKKYPQCKKVFIGGHSLGGAAAAMCVDAHISRFDGLFFLAAYSSNDITDFKGKIVSIYGTNDGVLNMEKYKKYKTNLPADYKEFIIDGGCHSYFGYYGMQEGDGEPTISREEQMNQTIEILLNELK